MVFSRRAGYLGSSALLITSLSGCGDFLSESGPGREAVVMNAAAVPVAVPAKVFPYQLVNVNATTLQTLDVLPDRKYFNLPPSVGSTPGTIGIGDDVGITIFEAGPGGLFITDHPENQSGNSITLPPQQVDQTGNIVVPYGGAIPVVGLTPASVQRAIERRLASRALEPQVVVTILARRSGMINVAGDVAGAARFSLDPGGETILGAISRAGGPRFPDYETTVVLHRGSTRQTVRLSTIVDQPAQNLPLEPGDTIYLTHEPDFFLAMGATGQATSLGPLDRRITFGGDRITLADALAKAGGLEDDRANARACFIYRLQHGQDGQTKTNLPTIYLTDLHDPAGYFYASRFVMHPEDVIFVSNAPETDIAKFLNLVLPAAYSAAGFNSGLR